MTGLDHPSLLTRLILVSEAAIQMRHGPDREQLIDLVAAIEDQNRKPSDRPRVISDEVVMCAQAVLHADKHLRSFHRRHAVPFLQVVGVLLPQVRHAMELALEERNRPTS